MQHMIYDMLTFSRQFVSVEKFDLILNSKINCK